MDILFEDKEDVLDRAQEARQEALKACSLDEGRSYYEAIEHYDQAITVIDEILRDISADAPVWERLISNDSVQEELREHLRNEVLARSMSRKNRRLSRVVFDEKADPAIARCEPREEPPEDRPGVSYWLMRVIRSTILAGGFISAEVYVPKIVWTQVGAKFHAIGAKVSALEHLMILVTTHIYPLEYPDDVHSSEEVTNAFSVFYRELVSLQNNLSKPFTYIKEIPVPGQAPTPNPTTQVGRLTSIFSAVGKNVIKYAEVGYSRIGSVMKTRVSDQEMAAYVALASELCEKCQVLDGWQMFLEKELKIVAAEAEKPILPKKSTPVAKLDLTSLIAHNVGSPSPRKDYSTPREDSGAPSPQQVVKKATSELVPGISPSTPPPLPVSMSPRLSSPRLPSPYDSPRESPRPPSRRMSKNMYDMEKARVCADHSQEGMHEPQRCDIYRADISVGDSHILAAQHLVRLQELFVVLSSISDFMRNVFCELLLQDMEYLLCRYLKKTRRGLAHLYWDNDDESKNNGGRGMLERGDSSISLDD